MVMTRHHNRHPVAFQGFPHPDGYAMIASRRQIGPAGSGDAVKDRSICPKFGRCGQVLEKAAKQPQRRVFGVVGSRVRQVIEIAKECAIHNGTTPRARVIRMRAPACGCARERVIYIRCAVVDSYFRHEISKLADTATHNGKIAKRCDHEKVSQDHCLSQHEAKKGGF